uniref:Putative basic tail protein n=1 Tax=Ixodes ricinus TaxID=34613 RepID=A0A6B0UD29_IXORI
MALGINLLVAGSEVQAKEGSQEDRIHVQYCNKNCTIKNEASSGCSKDCKCVFEGNNPQGICISISYLEDYPELNYNDPELIKASPQPPRN